MNAICTVAIGFDGSSDSRTALLWAAMLTSGIHGSLKVVHAVGLLEHAGISNRSTPHRDAALEIANGAGIHATAVEWLVVDGDPCSALLRMTAAPNSLT